MERSAGSNPINKPGEGSWEFDLETQVLSWSPEQYEIYGYKPYEFRPDSNFFIIKTTHFSEVERISEIVTNSVHHHSEYHFRRRIIRRNGTFGFVETNAVISRSLTGKALRISGTTIDLKNRHAAKIIDYNDPEYFNFLYANYNKSIALDILKMVKDKNLAEDLCQEVFVKLWNNMTRYKPECGTIYTWMIAVSRNHCRDFIKSKYAQMQKLTSRIDEALEEEIFSNGLDVSKSEIQRYFSVLTPEQTDLLNLLFVQGYTQQEVSQMKCLPLGTIKTKSRGALKKLRGFDEVK